MSASPARLTFFGAAGEVTGSGTLVETGRARVLVDFGLFQGSSDADEKNALPAGLDPAALDAVVLTHGHLDHVGRLPLLYNGGFRGQIYCTQATGEVAGLILEDSARIQAQDLERRNRRRERAGKDLLEPLYSPGDVAQTLRLLHAVPYDTPVHIAPNVSARWGEAGHMIGSASVLLTVDGGKGRRRSIVFSGDLGPSGAPILKDPEPFRSADHVVLESTYGDRNHRPIRDTIDEFETIVKSAVERRSRILIPSFAVGRSQLLIYLLGIMFRRRVVEPFPVFLDSPMAIRASEIYDRHPELMDEEFNHLDGLRPLDADLGSLKLCRTADESRAINRVPGPMMVIAGSGMCTGGRILHHFRHGLWKRDSVVVIVGYQGRGTLGRLLVDGADEVKIFGEPVAVRASVHTLGGFSAHAGRDDLLDWFRRLAPNADRPGLVLNHGEPESREALAETIERTWGTRAILPGFGEAVALD